MINQELVDATRAGRTLLFVGAGVSMCAGLPSWRELIDLMAKDLGYDPEVFALLGSFDQLAEFYVNRKRTIGSLRSELDRAWHKNIDIKKSQVHEHIAKLGFNLIYTTNFDRYLELALSEHGVAFSKIVTPSDISKASGTQLVKLHGDFDDDNSLVLGETHFYKRLDFESPLDIKLRADLLGRTVLFLGYSLSDMNIRYMLFRLQELWRRASVSDPPRSFIWLTRPNVVQSAVLEARGVTALTSELDDPKEGMIRFLRELRDEVAKPTFP